MSITPVEGDGEEGQENRELARDQRQGVRARVRSWIQSIGQQLRNLHPRSQDSDSDPQSPAQSVDQEKGEIRVSGQRRLESAHRQSTQEVESVEISTVQPELPSTSGGDTVRDGNRLHNPDRPDAYITSDTWEDIKR